MSESPVPGMPNSSAFNRTIKEQAGLLNTHPGFSQTYVALGYISDHIDDSRSNGLKTTADALLDLILSTRFENRKQAFFLYRQAADILIRLAVAPASPARAGIITALQQMLPEVKGRKQRAISEALGSLPVRIKGPEHALPDGALEIRTLPFSRLLELTGLTHAHEINRHGRTFRFRMPDQRYCCIKFARTPEDLPLLAQEASWLLFFKHTESAGSGLGDCIPEPVLEGGHCLFQLASPPPPLKDVAQAGLLDTAMIYLADPEYFHYPNDPSCFQTQDPESRNALFAVFKKNARILGQMTASGVIHTALIPLFHNRVQQDRRQDHGFYLWEMGGRLDRWLESSRYPNFAASGIRDFEHLLSLDDAARLRHHIGEHLLGFVLVLGSCFRNQAPERVGYQKDGTPVDTRDLFSKDLFKSIFTEVVQEYYTAVTGMSLKTPDTIVSEGLIDELIDKMGVDRDMEEALRIQDQERMTDEEFIQFLAARGIAPDAPGITARGQADIFLHTGPHLGGFSQPISTPLLIECLFCLSALCISDRYVMENGLKAVLN